MSENKSLQYTQEKIKTLASLGWTKLSCRHHRLTNVHRKSRDVKGGLTLLGEQVVLGASAGLAAEWVALDAR